MKRTICWLFVSVFLLPAALLALNYPPPSFLSKWGSFGTGDGEFRNPRALVVSAAGLVYVADASNDRVQRFSRSGVLTGLWGTSGSSEGQFESTEGVAIDSSGNVYVSDFGNWRIQKFDGVGSFLLMWGWGVATGADQFEICTSSCQNGIAGPGDGQLSGSAHLAVDSADNLYVVDYGGHRIQKFNKDGGFLTRWGAFGATEGNFNYPTGIAVDEAGYVYVGDGTNHRVQKFDGSGTFQRMWGWGVASGAAQFEVCTSGCLAGISGSGDGQFNYSVGVAVDARGDVYVVDQANHRVQKFTSDGVLLMKWGSPGTGDGQFNQPVGIAISPLGEIYVGDQVNQRIQRFKGHPLSYYKASPVPSPSVDF